MEGQLAVNSKPACEEQEKRIKALEEESVRRMQIEEDLRERVKELNCFYSLANIIERAGSIDELLRKTVDQLPDAFLYPEYACARITLKDQEFVTPNFQETERKLSANLIVHGAPLGIVEIRYTEKMPDKDNGPFIKEECVLVDAVAERLGRVIERKRAEDALRESEQKYRALHESMRDGFVSVDLTGRIRECNEPYRQMLGYTREELLHLTYADLTPERWHAFEQDIVDSQILPKGHSEVYQKEYRRKDGTVFPVELRTVLVEEGIGKEKLMWAIVRDITERKQAEEALLESEDRYRRLHESLRDGFGAAALNGRILNCNHVFLEMLGYPEEELLQLTFQDITPERWHEHEAVILEHQVLTRGYSDVYEKEYRRRDGSLFPVELRAYLMRDRAGQPSGYWATMRDITERKRAEAERERLIRELQESLAQIKTLRGLLPICACCKRIRNDQGYWEQIEVYIRDHSDAEFSHSICRECARKLYPDLIIDEN